RMRFAQNRHFFRIGRADNQKNILELVPLTGCSLRDVLIQRSTVQEQILKVARTRIRSAAQNNGGASGVFDEWPDRILAQLWIYRDGIGLVAFEGFLRITLGRIANISAFGIQDDDDLSGPLADVVDREFELSFRPD